MAVGKDSANYIDAMDDPQLRVHVEADLLREDRFRWTLTRLGRPQIRSAMSFPSRQEAEQAASEVLGAHIAEWMTMKRAPVW
jgi:hypothetical protein